MSEQGNNDVQILDLELYSIPPAELTGNEPKEEYQDYVNKGLVLREVGNRCQWAMGDLLFKMELDLKDEKNANGNTPLDELAKDIGEKPGTLRQAKWVSTKFPESIDRETHLSWSHYRTAAGTKDPKGWIQRAIDNDWTVLQLKDEIQKAQDTETVTTGTPCQWCGAPLPSEGSIFIRRGKERIALCSVTCMFGHYMPAFREEKLQGAKQSGIPVNGAPYDTTQEEMVEEEGVAA